ncbi:MAG: alpha/beta hydrolase-fold protein [Saprospiraceae bacterium]|nr:alpha/beta hydrolase-fold protein [Saprospiraceae bacterium]
MKNHHFLNLLLNSLSSKVRINWLLLFTLLISCTPKTPEQPYQDLSHTSQVFKQVKPFRIYFPDTYPDAQTRYPVIYFFHGWGGRHFKDDNAKLEYERIKDLVDKYQIILVMWDGNITLDQPRPYNIGNHENINAPVQMSEYFIELMRHIDTSYRTLPERRHRGIIGFSMGGFLSYFIAGKYPDRITAAVNMTGSPEFFVGHPDNHTLYPLRYTFKNLSAVHLRFHNSTEDELTDLNKEVHQGARWEGGLSYDYWVFEGGHKVDDPGKTEVFEKAMKFVVNSFNHPNPSLHKWGHYDIYPSFKVWDYSVLSTKNVPGFIYLKGVTVRGFGIKTHQWLPAGPIIPGVNPDITTAPLYLPREEYQIVQYPGQGNKWIHKTLTSDSLGRLHFPSTPSEYETGIYRDGDNPEIIVLDYKLSSNRRYLRAGNENKFTLQLFNRGSGINTKESITIKITSRDTSVRVNQTNNTLIWDQGKRLLPSPEFIISVNKNPPSDGSPAELKFEITIHLDSLQFEDELVVPVFYNVPEFKHFLLDDGRQVKDSVVVFGHGNQDGIANAGEQIMVYVDGHRTRIYSDDPYLEHLKEKLVDEALPAKWPDGFTLSSVISIDPACPDGHRIACLFNYETKSFMPITRKLTWGKLWIEVKKTGSSKPVPLN